MSEELSVCDIPYAGDTGLKMTIVMPKANLEKYEASLTDNELKRVFSMTELGHNVAVTIPKFKIENKINLKKAFTTLGKSV